MSAADRFGASFRKTEMHDLASRDEALHRASNVLDRHVRIDSVLIEQVDFERRFGHSLYPSQYPRDLLRKAANPLS